MLLSTTSIGISIPSFERLIVEGEKDMGEQSLYRSEYVNLYIPSLLTFIFATLPVPVQVRPTLLTSVLPLLLSPPAGELPPPPEPQPARKDTTMSRMIYFFII